jgi:glycosyltransferase involved in cell wall biosynthesis
MKVTLLFSGLPHYLIALLNRLESTYGIDVSLIIPTERGMSLGEGVRQGDPGATQGDPGATQVDSGSARGGSGSARGGPVSSFLFSIHRLEEFRGRLNKPYFRNLSDALEEIDPDVLVIGWPYIINFYFDSAARRLLRERNISLVYREIPFMVAPKNRAMSYYRKHPVINENLEVDNPRGCRFYLWAFGLNQMRKRIYGMVDATMIYSSHGFEVQESFGIPRERIFLTYNSPDTETIARTRVKLIEEGLVVTHPKRILHLGRLVKWKRVDLLIEAVSDLAARHEGIEMCIIGSGPEEQSLKELAQRKAPPGVVRFLGSIYDPEELGREIIASGIYVLAGMGGLSINEVMAYGKPVICSRCDGTERDLVTDGFNGYFFREGDAEDLASKIELLLNDPVKADLMGKNALKVIGEKINLQTVTGRFMDCFNYLVNNDNDGHNKK